MEYIDIVDNKLKYIRRARRGDKLKANEFFTFVHVWLIKGDKILIQRRSEDRLWAPGKWATHTGVVSSGEEVSVCAVREVYEEMGIKLNEQDVKCQFKLVPNNNFKGIGFIFFARLTDQEIKIDNDEVCDYKYVSVSELQTLISEKEFVNYGKNGLEYQDYFQRIFKIIDEYIGV